MGRQKVELVGDNSIDDSQSRNEENYQEEIVIEVNPNDPQHQEIQYQKMADSDRQSILEMQRLGNNLKVDHENDSDSSRDHNEEDFSSQSSYYQNQPAPAAVQQPNQYPSSVPIEVQEQLEKEQIEMKIQKGKLCLNCIPGLRGKTSRQKFIIKVYTILLIELAITFGFIIITQFSPSIVQFMKTTRWLFWTSLGVTLSFCIALFCFNVVARKFPVNYIVLSLFTLSSTYMLAAISSFQDAENVLIAAALTFAVFFGLTILTFFTRFELTILSGLTTILCHVMIVLIPLFIVFRERWIYILVCIAVILIISIFIIYDTQLIASSQKYGLSYDDYIIGALLLYTDIVTLFLWLLALLAASRQN